MVRIAQPRPDTRLARDAEGTRLARSWPCCRRPRAAAESLALFAPAAPVDDATRERLALLRGAIDERFRDETGRTLADLWRRFRDLGG